jgi:hypothetical protein
MIIKGLEPRTFGANLAAKAVAAWLGTPVHIALALAIAAGLWATWHGISRIPEHYKAIGRTECQQATNGTAAKAIAAQAASTAAQAASDVARASTTGQAFEQSRARINTHYARLATEARHDPISSIDSSTCTLPPDSAAAATPASLGPDGRPGGQPPGRGPGLPPAGQPALQPARVPGGRPQ